MGQTTFTWDELAIAYEAMLRECSNSDEYTLRRWIGFAQGMTNLIPCIRNLPDLDNLLKWMSHNNLGLKVPDRELLLNIYYDDSLYVLQLYRRGELWNETRTTFDEVVNQLQNQIKTMREVD